MKYLFKMPGCSATVRQATIYLLTISLLIIFLASACEKGAPELRCIPNLPVFLEGGWEVTKGILDADGVYTTGARADTLIFRDDGTLVRGSGLDFCREPSSETVSSAFIGCSYTIESRRKVAMGEYQSLPNKVYVIENYGVDDYMLWRSTLSVERCYIGKNAAEFRRIE